MEREIKFRAWNGERMRPVNTISFNEGWIDTPKENSPIEDFKLMQFTGLTDKNGVEIYEGDIDKYRGIVVWNDLDYCWSVIDLTWNDRREWHSLTSLTSPYEVIGNIYENPELDK